MSPVSIQMGSDMATATRQAFMTDLKATEHSCTLHLYSAYSTFMLALWWLDGCQTMAHSSREVCQNKGTLTTHQSW